MCEQCGNKPGELMGKYQANKEEILKDLVNKLNTGFVLMVVDNYGEVSLASNLSKELTEDTLRGCAIRLKDDNNPENLKV